MIARCCDGAALEWGSPGWREGDLFGAGTVPVPVPVRPVRGGGGGDAAAEEEDGEEAAAHEGADGADEEDAEEDESSRSSHARALPSYEAHADGGAGVGLHAGRVALVLSSSFLSGEPLAVISRLPRLRTRFATRKNSRETHGKNLNSSLRPTNTATTAFHEGFNGMQQRAAQVVVAIGKLGFAVRCSRMVV